MHSRFNLPIFAILVFVLAPGAEAQEFGKGKFLKRLRNDIFGKRDSKDKEKDAKSKKSKQNSTTRVPTEATRPQPGQRRVNPASANQRYLSNRQRAGSQNQPVGSGYNQRQQTIGKNNQRAQINQPSQVNQQSQVNQPSYRRPPGDSARRSSNQVGPTPAQIAAQARSAMPSRSDQSVLDDKSFRIPTPPTRPGAAVPTRQTSARKKSSMTARLGFGMTFRQNGDSVIVQQVAKDGNAAEAGIRPGDEIVELGGLEIQSDDDVEEFSSILSQGDQMEFKIRSRGKKKTVMVTYGEMPEEPTQETDFQQNDGGRSILERAGNDLDAGSPEEMILRRTIANQRREIETLRQELVRLRQQSQARDRQRQR